MGENIVLTQEGLNVELDVSLLYHIDLLRVREIYLQLGEAYEETLIMPELQSAVRGLTSEVSAKALYTSGRTEIHDKLHKELTEKLTAPIELKAQAEQESARMEFVLSKERQEADRKKVEAAGISAFQKIVSEGISSQLLQWKGIEATERLANSNNAKIVVMGNTKDSLPVLLSTASDEAGAAANAAPATKP